MASCGCRADVTGRESVSMKVTFALASLGLLVVTAGCEVETGYGGSYGVVGEYPNTYYAPVYPAPVYPYRYYGHAYDRDHYFDRDYHWDRHHWHHDRD